MFTCLWLFVNQVDIAVQAATLRRTYKHQSKGEWWKWKLKLNVCAPLPTYSESVSPLEISLPGMFTTNQWCHSLNLGSLRDGASGSVMQRVYKASEECGVYVCTLQ